MLSNLTGLEAGLLLLGALGIGVSKSGFPGVGMLHVVLYAGVLGAKESTGVLLPMLIVGDVCAIRFFGRRANWSHIRRLLPPALVGIILGAWLMDRMTGETFTRIVGTIILLLTLIQIARLKNPDLFDHVPHQRWFAITLGLLGGLTTMMANAAGPVFALFLLAVSLPKMELIGTSAWLFLVLNCFKVPFSYGLGLITPDTLLLGAAFCLAIPAGMMSGRWLINRVSQSLFNGLILAFTAFTAFRMLWAG